MPASAKTISTILYVSYFVSRGQISTDMNLCMRFKTTPIPLLIFEHETQHKQCDKFCKARLQRHTVQRKTLAFSISKISCFFVGA